MTEQKQEKKRNGLAQPILRFIGLGILTLLILSALVFEVSLKIIILLMIILAAFTVLPKPARKWFWLSTGVVVFVLVIWVFLPEDNEGWRPYTFYEEIAAFEAKYSIPDEENAATIYDALLGDYDPNTYYTDFLDLNLNKLASSEPWLSRDYPKLASWLKGHQGIIAELIRAAHKDKCYFPVSTSILGSGRYGERFATMRHWLFLLLYAGNNDIAECRIDAGIEKYLCIIRMGNHLHQQSEVANHLVGHVFETRGLIPLNRFVVENRLTNEQLQHIANSVRGLENDWDSNLKRMIEYDKLVAKNRFCSLVYEVNQKGVRFNRDPKAVFREVYPKKIPPLTYLQKKLNKAKTILIWFVYPSTPQKVAEVYEVGFKKYDAMAKPVFNWKEKPQNYDSIITKSNLIRGVLSFKYHVQFVADMLLETYYRLNGTYLRVLTLRRGSRLLVAIKQYHNENGAWPDGLDAIKSYAPPEAFLDPVTGNPLQYENHGARFSLYGEATNIWPK